MRAGAADPVGGPAGFGPGGPGGPLDAGGGGEPLMVEKLHSFARRQAMFRAMLHAFDTNRTPRPSFYLRRQSGFTDIGKSNSIVRGTGQRKPSTAGLPDRWPTVRWIAVILLPLAALLTPIKSARAEVDAAKVQRAIDRGITYLRATQNERGGWGEYPGQSCGLSSLCTLAMLNSGVPRDDPAVVRSMRYLRSFEPIETYSLSLQTLVFCQLGAAGDLRRIRHNVDTLVRSQKITGNRTGAWDYGAGKGSGDPSNAQFALLALGAAQDRGIQIDPEVFQRSLDYWTKRQRDGAWSYRGGGGLSGSMTCAGIASTVIARSGIQASSSKVNGDNIQCCGGASEEKDPVEEGLEWLARNFTMQVNPGGDSLTFYYYIYALERVGRLTGRRFIGNHDWYREGAERLLELQDEFRGFWSGNGGTEANIDVTTAFALLFLSKGKRQVVVGRLKYENKQAPRQWQQHPDSLRQLVRHVERDWGRDLTWQTIESKNANLNDLLQAPVIVISGQQAIRFDADLSDNLKEYINQGGCILFEADGGDGCGNASDFETSVQRLCQNWFEGAKLERLPPTHPIWFAEHRVDPTSLDPDHWIYGVQACCRTAVFYSPRSLSCRWELGDVLFHRDRVSRTAKRKIESGVRIGQNLIAYATGRELKDKLEQRVVLKGEAPPVVGRNSIQLASLAIDAGGQEARRALPNATALITAKLPVAISAAPKQVGFDADQLVDVPFLWVHGRTEFSLNKAQRSILREYVLNGGVILGSSVCGAEAFGDSFRREFALILPDSPLNTLPPNHRVFKAFGGFDVSQVTIRTPGIGGMSGKGVNQRVGQPVLEAAIVDGLVGVFFSPLDLSCALESPNSVQCPGYSTQDAAKIVANLVLYGLGQ